VKVLISTWGLPAEWKDVEYNYEDRSARGCSTLQLLEENYDRIFILTLESIFDYNNDRTRKYDNISKCRECYIENTIRYETENYKDFIERGELALTKMIGCIGLNTDKVKVIILPSIGHPGPTKKFDGNVKNYASVAMVRLFDELMKISDSEHVEEICLDTSHGLNFMPTISLDISRFISQLIFFKQAANSGTKNDGNKIRFRALNADPLPRIQDYNFLGINEVLNETINSLPVSLEKDNDIYLSSVNGELHKDEELKSIYYYIRKVIKSSYYPFPILLGNYSRDIKGIQDMRNKILDKWLSDTIIDNESITHNGTIGPKFIKDLLTAEVIINVIKSIIGKKDRVSLEDIKNMNEKVYKSISEINHVLINQEISEIEKFYKGNPIHSKELLKMGKMGDSNPIDEPVKRIMIAHAGFQIGLVYIYPGEPNISAYSFDYENYKEVLKKTLGKGI